MKNYSLLLVTAIIMFGCDYNSAKISETATNSEVAIKTFAAPEFTLAEANKLIELPLHCVNTPYPYKPGETLESKADLVEPVLVHPIFLRLF